MVAAAEKVEKAKGGGGHGEGGRGGDHWTLGLWWIYKYRPPDQALSKQGWKLHENLTQILHQFLGCIESLACILLFSFF